MSEPQPAPTSEPERTARGSSWIEAVPLAVVVLVGAPVIALRPAIVQGTLSSPRALMIAAGVTAAIVVWSAVLRRFAIPTALRSALVLVPIALAGFLWIRPYFTDTRVDEQISTAALAGPSEQASTDSDQAGTPSASATPDGPDRAVPQSETPSASESSSPSPSPEPTEPVAVTRGEFVGLDGHRAAGNAAVFRLPDDSLVVRLEGVDL